MEVTFDYTREDYWQFTNYIFLHFISSLERWGILIVYALFGMIVVSEKLWWIVINLLVGVAIYFSIFLRAVMKFPSLPSGKPGILGDHSVTISADGVHERTPVGHDYRTWQGIRNVVYDRKYIHIFFVGIVQGISIPRRAFSSESEMQQFYEIATSYWKNATATGATE